MSMNAPSINHEFPNLDRSPIVEAILYFQTRTTIQWGTHELSDAIKKHLPDYPNIEIEKNLEIGYSQSLTDPETPFPTSKRVLMGLRFQANDQPNFALFRPDSFTFSRLKPYQKWETFASEALRLWDIYCELAKPIEIQRLGVRFINQIPLKGIDELAQILKEAPTTVGELPLKSFFYQSSLAVDRDKLEIGIIKTMSPETGVTDSDASFYLDIDVYTVESISTERDDLITLLPKLRYYKNKVFFDLLTESKALSFRGAE